MKMEDVTEDGRCYWRWKMLQEMEDVPEDKKMFLKLEDITED